MPCRRRAPALGHWVEEAIGNGLASSHRPSAMLARCARLAASESVEPFRRLADRPARADHQGRSPLMQHHRLPSPLSRKDLPGNCSVYLNSPKRFLHDIMSRARGRGRSISTISSIVPGRLVITMTRSDRNTASGMEWVMRTLSSTLRPDALQLEIHVLARHGVEGPERLVHQQDARSLISARQIAARCCMPPDSSEG